MLTLLDTIFSQGIQSTDSAAKKRAIKISNAIGFSAVLNCLIFMLPFFFVEDFILIKALFLTGLAYGTALIFSLLGYPNIGRPLILLGGNLAIFWYASIFRGESLLQLFFFSLCICPFIFFAWEERRWYSLSMISVFLLLLGQANSWEFFEPHSFNYDLNNVKIFSLLAPLSQIIIGYFYYINQSTKFESESNFHLQRLELEYQRNMHNHKMSSLGEMSAGISHEINNPLMIILGSTFKLKKNLKDFKDEGEAEMNIQRIERTVRRIERIVLALKKFSRNAEHDKPILTEASSIMEDTMDLCQERFRNCGINIVKEVEDGLKVVCRPSEISQVLVNLLNNSYDALEKHPNPQVKLIARSAQNGFAEIIIEDNGEGIPDEMATKIMEPFFTTKDVGIGTGLGLSLSKGIIESHKGKISLIHNQNPTIFQILLPKQNDTAFLS